MWWMISTVMSFYIPGMTRRAFKENSPIEVYVDKLISDYTEIPYDYYELNFCKDKNPKISQENIGQ
jgi:transmembrane 9 superfamily protein 2/4